MLYEEKGFSAVMVVEALEQVAQRCGGSPILGDIQGQAGLGSEHPDGAVYVPVHCRSLPTQTSL